MAWRPTHRIRGIRCGGGPDEADVLAVTSETNKRREGLTQGKIAAH